MKRQLISGIFADSESFSGKTVTVAGWARTIRDSKAFGFIELNDGSCFKSVQVVFEAAKIDNYEEIAKLNVGSALVVTGELLLTPEAKQPFEIKAAKIEVEGKSTPDYPLQKKRHGVEFLREIAHLRPRTNLFNATMRVRSKAAYALHKFFNERNFVYVHTPIITGSDCEGAGEMFRITTLDLDDLPRTPDGKVDYSQDFFGKQASLTVSGQLNVETYAMAFGNVYTFGPTFRAEKSNTQRHAAEFWMVEPEIAFADLSDDMELAQDMTKYVVGYILENCPQEIEFFNGFVDNTLKERLTALVNSEFHGPVFVTDWPKEIKSFYMRVNDDDKTVAAMDMLVPGVGELIGGSQREERLDVLEKRMKELHLSEKDYWWYIDLRRYGGTKHAGFGIGFERLVMYLTGVQNIRDVLPFPRTVGTAEF